jgi:flagellar hook-associated protein 2
MASSIDSTSSSTTATSTTSTAQSTTAATSALFQASGLSSGLDTAAIVDALIQADSIQLNSLKQKASDYQVQISTLGTLVSQVKALQTAASNLATNGVVSIVPTSTFADFTTSGSAKAEGNYAIQVSQLAKAAKMRSTSFTSAQDAAVVPDGTLQFSIDGTTTASIETTGKTLADVAEAINQSIGGLTASVISTDTGYYLNVARTSTGFSTTADAALVVVSDAGLGLVTQQAAQNASLTVDGLPVSRQSNTISDVIPGITLNLTGNSGVSNSVSFAADSSGTEKALTTFVDAYNTLAQTLTSQLVTDPSQRYGNTLIGYSTSSTIENAMQSMLSQTVLASGGVRTLADLGLELQRDGTLELNAITLQNAVKSNPSAVNAIFSTATTGIAATLKTLSDNQTNVLTGTLVLQQNSLTSSVSDLSDQEIGAQAYLDAERARLVEQFTNMETLISGYKTATSYLTQIANLQISK